METNAAISAYLKRVGVRRYPSFKSFQKYLERRHGRDVISELLDVIDRRGEGDRVDIYPLVYASLDLSIDFLGFEGELHANFLRWLLKQYADIVTPPSRILDVGCGNGVLSCFYASHFGASEVFGIDSSAEGIACAEELKKRLNLTNVSFIKTDFVDSGLSSVAGEFDLITAVKSVGTVVGVPHFDHAVPLFRVTEEFSDSNLELLSDFRERLAPSGVLVTSDLWSSVESFCWWVRSLNDSGFRVDFDYSGRIEYRMVTDDRREQIPVLWNKRDDNVINQLSKAIGFWLHVTYTDNWAKLKTFDFQHELAEMAFAFINPKTFVFGIKSEHEAGGIFWRETWLAGPFLLVYQFTNNGIRRLEVLPGIFEEDAEKHLRELASNDPEGTRVSTYDNPQFNWDSYSRTKV